MSQIEVSERDRAHDIAAAAWKCIVGGGRLSAAAAVPFIEEALVGFGVEQRARGWNEAREAAAGACEKEMAEVKQAMMLVPEGSLDYRIVDECGKTINACLRAIRALAPPTEPTGTGG